MNIGVVLYRLYPEAVGGAEIQGTRLAEELARKGHQVTIFSGSRTSGTITESQRLKIIKIKYADRKIVRIFLSQMAAFFPQIRKEAARLDILLCYQVNPAGMVGLISKWALHLPLVIWIRAETEYKAFLRKHFITPLVLRFSNRIIVQTPKIKRELIHAHGRHPFIGRSRLNRIEVIPNGVEVSPFPPAPFSQRQGVLYAGRLHRDKGVEYLISAMDGIGERLSIIGDGPESWPLRRMAEGRDIEFLGELGHREVLQHMGAAKLLVLPTLGEGMPNVVLEAMSAGCPVISTRTGGIPDFLEHGKTGFLVEPKDVQGIREHIRLLSGDERLWQEIQRNCLLEARKYSWDRVEEEVEKTLRNALD